jgi:hypothetical protein
VHKSGLWTAAESFSKAKGLTIKKSGPTCRGSLWWKDRLEICEKDRGSLERLPTAALVDRYASFDRVAWTDGGRWISI